jgi:hypothetical protein
MKYFFFHKINFLKVLNVIPAIKADRVLSIPSGGSCRRQQN